MPQSAQNPVDPLKAGLSLSRDFSRDLLNSTEASKALTMLCDLYDLIVVRSLRTR